MIYNIFVLDDKRNNALDKVELPSMFKDEFIYKFGLFNLPLKSDFEEWLEYALTFSEIEKFNLK